MAGRGGRFLILGAIALLGLLLFAAPAIATETVIGFDHFPGGAEVPAGTIVGDQWEAEGLKLGTAEEFGQASVAGDCGKPKVEREEVTPASPPCYAGLPICIGAPTQGTFGALTAPARGSLSVEVHDLYASAPTVPVKLIGYSSSEKIVAEGQGEATGGPWQVIKAALYGQGNISYFSIFVEAG